jgi:hypothetical protein
MIKLIYKIATMTDWKRGLLRGPAEYLQCDRIATDIAVFADQDIKWAEALIREAQQQDYPIAWLALCRIRYQYELNRRKK